MVLCHLCAKNYWNWPIFDGVISTTKKADRFLKHGVDTPLIQTDGRTDDVQCKDHLLGGRL